MSLLTANWNYLGEEFYKKFEICQMLWNATISLGDYQVSMAPFGGPIALMPKENTTKRSTGTVISIYSAVGDLVSSFVVQETIVNLGWSHKEEVICVQSNGFISLYDLFGQHQNTLTLDQEIRDSKIIDCKIFKNVFRTGIAILTGSFSFYLYNNIHELKIRRLAEVPYLVAVPLCWDVIAYDKDTKLVVSREKELCILKSQDLSCTIINPFRDEQKETVTMMSVSFDYSHIALFTETGKLYLAKTANDISSYLSIFDTESKIKPRQLAWCGNDAVAGHWTNLIFFMDLNKNWLKYPTYSNVYMVQEIDSIRVVDDYCQEMIKKVERVVADIFKIGSWSSGANLLEANRLYELQNHKVDDYIRLIQEKNEMEMAVKMCLEAACHEFNVATQKMLLRAASFGKCFTTSINPNSLIELCQRLRILNAIRQVNVGIPLTYCQLEMLTINSLLDRLIERHHFFLALRVANYLKMPAEEGSIKILTRWAFYKISKQDLNEEQIAMDIANKLQQQSGVSYAEIANRAIEYGRKNLAIKLLDYELKPTDQVPLLLKLKEYRSALQRAIESGNTNLIYMVVLRFKKIQSSEQFYLGLRDYPMAYALYQKYCKQDDRDQLRNIYFQENDLMAEGISYLEQTVDLNSSDSNWKKNKISLLSSALDTFKKSRTEFFSTHTDEYLRLLKYQLKLEEKFPGTKFYNLALQETLKLLLQNQEPKLCEEMRKEFKVPEKRYYHLKLMTWAEMGEWAEIEKLAKAKKSPIGYEPFVDICIQHHNRYEAQKYLAKVREDNKIKYFVKTGNLEDAAKFAFEKKDLDALEYIESKCGSAGNRVFQENLRSMISQLTK